MKKLLMVLMLVLSCSEILFAHAASSEKVKDDFMIRLDNQVDYLILSRGDLQGALGLYAQAAKNNTKETYYREQYSILRRVIKMEQAIKAACESSEINQQEKEQILGYVVAVRSYYFSRGYYELAVELDRESLAKFAGDDLKVKYLESILAAGNNHLAAEILANWQIDGNDSHLAVLQALGTSRTGGSFTDWSGAKQWAAAKDIDPLTMVYLGCLYQAGGKKQQAMELLSKAIEQTAPTQMSITKKLIAAAPEFSALQDDADFKRVLATESKIYQSGCTSGSSCNSCSLKDKCSSQK